MIKTDYANAYKEVLVILDKLTKEDFNKIPKEYIDFLKSNCNDNYEFYYDTSKNLNEQNVQEETKYILFGLFERFGATNAQKEKIKNFKDIYFNKIEMERRVQYNPENIFKNKNNNIEQTTNTKDVEKENISSLIIYKETFFYKLKKFLFKIFH